MIYVMLAIPFYPLLLWGLFALDEWREEREKAKEEKRRKEFEEKYLTKR